ncbi:amino acid abc superfamily atp binding cassette transporter, membrane protein [Amylolactobacillus amylotrophicus DSM 20534]|nr:amino acid abc superfamily atp binding cassette transporter, membrane protein [Amylolactobacillus amylotrophicus DSM 20534]KRM41474.1 amino acid abc superfamily atp binding cassette transporter, membrane protein [Amylolactobacillus amylophilus DSM 20533 = JCM 1125]GED80652.1 glutamine ABC transporter permease [Amylolactobacillus amylophilus]
MDWAGAYSWINIRYLLQGLLTTIEVSVIAIILSFILGAILGIIRYTKIKYVSAIIGFFIDIIRNLPLLLIIFFTYFGLPTFGIRLDIMPAAITALTVFESAMCSEIFRSGINAVAVGQMEAARANGMTYVQAMYHVVFPQALKMMIPPLLSQFVSLVKDTSLATIIVLPDLLYHAQNVYGQNTNYLIPIFVALAGMYFVVCFSLSLLAKFFDRRLRGA